MSNVPPALEVGVDHHRSGRLAEAAAIYRQVLAGNPRHAEALHLLGVVAHQMGRHDEARGCFERAVACNPRFYDALVNLAGALVQAKQFDQAADCLRRALDVRPDSPDAHLRLGDVHSFRGDWPAAVECYQKVLQLDPRSATAECHWAMVLQAQEQFDDALAHYRRALELAPHDVETHLNLAATLGLAGDEDQAAAHHRRVLEIEPTNRRALANLAGYLHERRRFAEALAYYDRALARSPDDAQLHFYRGLLLLAEGELPAGWEEYRWRTSVFDTPADAIEGPTWDGSASPDTVLLVHAEQGRGDAMQFVRYLPLVQQRVPRAMLVLPHSLVPLLSESGFSNVLAFSDPRPAFDCKISLLDLPRVLGTTVETIPAAVPYLSARESLVRQWATRLSNIKGFRVGICWQGNPTYAADHFRSIPLQAFGALARVPNVRLVSLQRNEGLDQLNALADPFEVIDLGPDFDTRHGAFMDTAAVLQNLDLVITSDTAIAHLAGAMARPVWVALSARPDWRWMQKRDDSPWYPTMRLFRQARLRDWPELFDRITAQLRALVDSRREE